MPRQSLNGDGGNGRRCKVRKRGGSSSSSSSLVRTYRLKRAVLVGKRGGSTTPVPMWKMMDVSRSPVSQNNANSSKYLEANGGDRSKEFSVSARKLAATLWEINGVSTLRGKENVDKISEGGKGGLKSSKLGSNSLADPSHSPVSEEMERSKVGSHRRRTSAGSEKILQANHSLQSICLLEVDQAQINGNSKTRHRLKELRHGLTTSKELLKVLSRVWSLEEQQSTCVSLFSALKTELDRACVQVAKLIQEQKENRVGEIDFVLKQLEEEKAVWKIKEQERIQTAITGELKTEKKLRKQTERLNKKLGRELADTKACLSKATKDLESERRAREILEQVCDELARGIGEDRAEVEELKRESAKVREEVEKEREMLQLADVLREERVQMKLSEAKYEFEEKNEAVDKLKIELESYLKFKKGKEEGGESPNYERIKALEKHLRETLPGAIHYQDNEKQGEGEEENKDKEKEEDDDSDNSDLHSIELNMDDINKSFEWSNVVYNDRTKGRKSTSSKPPRQSICLERQTSEGIVLEFTAPEGKENLVVHNNGYSHLYDDEIERYNMIKDLRDHIVSTASKTTSQDFTSPTKNWSHQTFSSHEIGDAFSVLQGAD